MRGDKADGIPGESGSRRKHVVDGTRDPCAGTGVIERIAPQPMAQGRYRHLSQVAVVDLSNTLKRRHHARRTHERELTTQTISAQGHTQAGRLLENRIRHTDLSQTLARLKDAPAHIGIGRGPLLHECLRIALEGIPTANHLDAIGQIPRGDHLDRKTETIEQLRAQLAFFGVATANEHEARGMTHAQTLTLNDVLA